MKQTAVEWLEEQLRKRYGSPSLYKLVEQAKELEKEQIIEAYDKAGKSVFHITGYGLSEKENKDFLITAEQYYNETFKSE